MNKKIMIVIFLIAALIIIIIGGCMLDIFKKDIKIENIKKLDFQITQNMSMYGTTNYLLKCEDKCIVTIKPCDIPDEKAQEVELSQEQVKAIEDLLNKYHVGKWDGFNKVDKRILDGRSFSISISLENGETISAHGYMKYPKNYQEVRDGLQDIIGSLYIEKEEE